MEFTLQYPALASSTMQQAATFLMFTLFHICWMGIGVGAIAWIGNAAFRSTTSAKQYRWRVVCFALLLACFPSAAVLTSVLNTDSTPVASRTELISATPASPSRTGRFLTSNSSDRPFIETGIDRSANLNERELSTDLGSSSAEFESAMLGGAPRRNVLIETRPAGAAVGHFSGHLPPTHQFSVWIAGAYLVGCVAMLIRLIASWHGCRRLICRSMPVTESTFLATAGLAAQKIGLRIVPMIATCERIATPVVVGCLRPMILLPSAVLTGLSMNQLEAILAHEMSHLVRYDHWVVVLQRCLETVLFFHPVSWWMSRELDRQRELCCDDLVVASGIRPLDYAESLYFVAKRGAPSMATGNHLAIAATGVRQSDLVGRIRRVLGEPPRTIRRSSPPVSMLGGLALLSIIPIALFVVMSGQSASPAPAIAIAKIDSLAGAILGAKNKVPTYPLIHGLVTDMNGDPVSGATVIIQENPSKCRRRLVDEKPGGLDDVQVLGQFRTEMDGRFDISKLPIPEFTSYFDSPYPITIVIIHDDYAIQWKHIAYIPDREFEFHLHANSSVSFQVELEDKDVANGVTAELVGLLPIASWNKSLDWKRLPSDMLFGLFTGRINGRFNRVSQLPNGRFEVSGLAPDMIAVLSVESPNHIGKFVYVTNRKQGTGESGINSTDESTVIPSGSNAKLLKASNVSFRIVDEEGEPITGVSVNIRQLKNQHWVYDLKQKTEVDGTVEFRDLNPGMKIRVGVTPPEGSRLLGYSENRNLPPRDSSPIVIPLVAGMQIKGKVVDDETGDTLSGIAVYFQAGQTPNDRSDQVPSWQFTNDNGEFVITVPKRSGELWVNGGTQKYGGETFKSRFRKIDGIEKMLFQDELNQGNPEAYTLSDTVLRLKKLPASNLAKLKIQVVDGSNKPAKNVVVRFFSLLNSGSTSMPRSQKTDDDGVITFLAAPKLFNATDFAAIAIDNLTGQAGSVSYHCPDPTSTPTPFEQKHGRLFTGVDDIVLTLKLEPLATISGRVTDSDTGQGIPRVTMTMRQRAGEKFNNLSKFFPLVETDDQGRFEIKAIAGLLGWVTAEHPSYLQPSFIMDGEQFTPAPGEAIELTRKLVAKEVSAEFSASQFQVPDVEQRTGMEAFEFLKARFTEDRNAFYVKVSQTTDPGAFALLSSRQCPNGPYVARMIELADEHRGQPVEVVALVWAMAVPLSSFEDPVKRSKVSAPIQQRILKDHIKSPAIIDCIAYLMYAQQKPGEVAAKILADNPHKNVQGIALLNLAEMAMRKLDVPNVVSQRANLDWASSRNEHEAEAHALFTRIKNEFADVPYWRNDNLGTVAKMQLFELEHLGIGDPVIEVSGNDLNGEPLKLSEYRGKFVVLDFWGSTCGPCIRELPNLNELSKKYADDLVVIGVMDDGTDKAKQVVFEHAVRWRNIAEGARGANQKAWNIDSWPTTYLIGRDGKIIDKGLRGDDLADRIRFLLHAESEAGKSKKGAID